MHVLVDARGLGVLVDPPSHRGLEDETEDEGDDSGEDDGHESDNDLLILLVRIISKSCD